MIGSLILRLTIWFLLTSDLSLVNIIIGVVIAFLLPRGYTSPERFKDWLRMIKKILIAIPVAYIEAFEIIIRPHNEEDIILERVKLKRSPIMIFLDVFVITFTPKTIVVRHNHAGSYEVHRVLPRKKP
ncbi:Na+/H+ antiporter subunit E [Tychonema sp. LEGE 07203]|uniref:Na+/H+ antiporter subunit E n=1 Tax=Tychonema sp. LEGE 07203 TaxID=1828671 RepID=UPI001882C928|nr:Na+/H+ antiporter subunit E [Tychonema sp. LEGE 07203]MBE9093141.1 Na+/H+ antiporter subunit E [Tychonema sp. LEGE 07203]